MRRKQYRSAIRLSDGTSYITEILHSPTTIIILCLLDFYGYSVASTLSAIICNSEPNALMLAFMDAIWLFACFESQCTRTSFSILTFTLALLVGFSGWVHSIHRKFWTCGSSEIYQIVSGWGFGVKVQNIPWTLWNVNCWTPSHVVLQVESSPKSKLTIDLTLPTCVHLLLL